MQFTNENFAKAEQVIDGNEYLGCKFEDCKIIYRGGLLPTINNCNFQNCNWSFEEGAERTLLFMKMLYHGMGDSGPELVESTIKLIRQPFA